MMVPGSPTCAAIAWLMKTLASRFSAHRFSRSLEPSEPFPPRSHICEVTTHGRRIKASGHAARKLMLL